MGCDIHMVLERQVNGKWIALRTFDGLHSSPDGQWHCPIARNRNYERFAALAGVRGDGPEARGIPDDVSETTKHLIDDYGSDGHSHSWLSIVDATAIFIRSEWQADKLSDFDRKYPEYYYFGVESREKAKWEHRLVFWFDN